MSNNNNNNWIEAIKNKADQATRDVPQGTWEAISKALPQQQPAKRGAIAPRLWKAAAAAAAVAIVATTGFLFINDDNNVQQPKQQLAQEIKQPAPAQPASEAEAPAATPQSAAPASPAAIAPSAQSLLAANTPAIPRARHSRQPAATKRNSSTPYYNDEYYYNDFDNQEEIIIPDDAYQEEYAEFNPDEYFYDVETMRALEELYAQYDNAMNQEAMDPWKTYADSTYQQHLVYDANARRAAREKMALTKHHKKPTMLLAAYGNGLISSDRDATVNSSAAQMLLAPSTNNSGMMMAPAAPGVTPRVAPPVNYKYHHHMPLTAGLTFNKRIVKNLYGSVGLNFTSMSSDVTPDNGAPEFKQNIKLIGLPFGVKWNFWHYRGFSTFIGGEGLVEKVVSARFNGESVSIKRLQWSVHATAGAQYNFTRNVGIYIAPKLSHYITTMPLNTIRNEHPLNFNLQFGLSLDF